LTSEYVEPLFASALRERIVRKKKRHIVNKTLPAHKVGFALEQLPLLRRKSLAEKSRDAAKQKIFEYNQRMARLADERRGVL